MADAAQDKPADQGAGVALTTLLSVMFINLLGFGIVVPLLPFYAKSFNAPPWQIALIFSAYAIGGFFGEPFWGRLSDRIGRKPILISTVTGNCLCYLALAFAPNVYVAFFVRLLGGMASGNGSVIQGYIADVSATLPTSKRTATRAATTSKRSRHAARDSRGGDSRGSTVTAAVQPGGRPRRKASPARPALSR